MKVDAPVEEEGLQSDGSNQRSDDSNCLFQETFDDTVQEKEIKEKKIDGRSGKILTIVATRTLRSETNDLQA